MKSRLFLNLMLLGLVAALGIFAIIEPGKKKPETTPLANIDENTLSMVTLRNKDTITFEKKDGRWRLAAPIHALANEIRVRQLIDIAKANSEAQYPLKQEDLAKFELDQPKASLVLGNTTLVFGGSDPIHMRRYVQIGDTLHLVNDDFFHHLMASATDYVDKKLLPENAKIKEIFLPGLKATLGSDGKWATEATGDTKADIPELVSLWNTARAIEVKRLEKPAQGDLVRIGLAEDTPIEFIIVQREPDIVLARQDLGLQYELTGESARQLLNLPKTEPRPSKPEPAASPEEPEAEGVEIEDEDRAAAEGEDKDDPGAPEASGDLDETAGSPEQPGEDEAGSAD